ncbi:MAG: FtsX-like permease family protein [Calditrichia bacterium]
MFIKMAWRNIFRNKRRTIIAGIAIGLGLASLIFVDALMIGMERNMIHSATASFMGEGQIHRSGYREAQDVELTINSPREVVSRLQADPRVSAFAERVMSFGMISSPSNINSVNIVGINPSAEKELSQIDEALQQGDYFEGGSSREILIGSELADILEVELGDRVVVTLAQAESGDLSQEMFRVSGIYHFNVTEMDLGLAFIQLEKARRMLGLGPQAVHEIALKFKKAGLGRDKKASFWQEYSSNGNEALGWNSLMPELEAVFELSQFSTYITGLILFGVVALGIINTLFMSIHERMFEFGVLRAVGTRPFHLGRLIIFEAGALALLSILLGNVLGFAATYIVAQIGIDYTGIDYTGIEFSGVTFRELLYPVMQLRQYVEYPFWVFIFTLVAGIYPAWYAAKMKPAEAMRKSF